MKPSKYMVPVVTWKLRWSKCALACLTIVGFTTNIYLVGLGKYPRASHLVSTKLKILSISSNVPPAAVFSAYHGCKLVGTTAFNCRVSSNILIPDIIMTRGLPYVTPSQLEIQ